jgi:ribosomal protein L40E
MTVTIEEGDGTMQRRLDMGLCPKCNTVLPEDPRSECRVCGLQIGSGKAQDEIDPESVISMAGALK